jgi:putative polyketide hydroxylase
MEIFRQCGVEAAVRAAGLAPGRSGFIVWTRSLAGEELERRIPARSWAEAQQISPVLRCLCAQDDLEPVLRAHAEALGPGELRFGTELVEFRQDADHVVATLRESGSERTVRARYLIAADGGIGPEGAVLVRPDGHVGWRCGEAAADPRRVIATVLRRLLATAD